MRWHLSNDGIELENLKKERDMHKKTLIVSLALYVLSSVVSFAAFSMVGSGGQVGPQVSDSGGEGDEQTALAALLEIDPGEPMDQACPLNGKYYTETEREAWEQKRPLAVMVENAPDSRPHSGISDADIVFEAVAEGGVTRFMPIYYCDVQRYDTLIAPVRSARSYFVDWASGFNWPMYVHVGGANIAGPADALGQISQYGWNLENDMNQFSIGYPTFVRNANRLGRKVATEHTMETSTERLWEVAEDRGWTNMSPERRIGRTLYEEEDWKDGYTGWSFQEEIPAPGDVRSISHEFWSGYSQYDVRWEYDPDTNSYNRFMGGEPHTDLNNGDQVQANTVIVLLTQEKGPIDELKHMLYTTTGSGNALVFMNGEVVEAAWVKKSRTAELEFKDRKGEELELARGMVWISVVDTSTEVDY